MVIMNKQGFEILEDKFRILAKRYHFRGTIGYGMVPICDSEGFFKIWDLLEQMLDYGPFYNLQILSYSE